MKNSNLGLLQKKVKEQVQEVRDASAAQKLYDEIFKNRFEILESSQLLVPNYLMILAKEKFYKKGGDPLQAYTIQEYSKLTEVPENILERWVKDKPEFFVFLHTKRKFEEEINTIVLVMAREMFNSFSTSSPRDKAQMLNSLAKFSSLLNPKNKSEDEEIDDMLSEIQDPSQLEEVFKSYGYEKTAKNIEYAITPTDINEDLLSIEETLEDD